MQGQEKAILDDNETEDHDPTTNVIGSTLVFPLLTSCAISLRSESKALVPGASNKLVD